MILPAIYTCVYHKHAVLGQRFLSFSPGPVAVTRITISTLYYSQITISPGGFFLVFPATNQQTIPTSYHLFPSCSRESTDNCSYTHQCLHFRHPQTHSETSSAENRNAKKLLAGQKKTRCLISRIFNIVVPVPSAIVITTSNIW